jgi:hypothetical protein
MSLSKFGPFAIVFAQGPRLTPGYLELLGLHNEAAQVVLDRLESAVSSVEASGFIDALFDEPNWRPHLVGAMALLIEQDQHFTPVGLWRAVDAGSWVTPQLVVTAYFVDPEFRQRLVERVEAMCPVSVPGSMSPLERHSATGPASPVQRSAKLMASLVFVGRRLPSTLPWVDAMCAKPRIAELLAQDVDDAAGICEDWLEQLTLQFARRGRQLKSKSA